jgi:hypothetical protein
VRSSPAKPVGPSSRARGAISPQTPETVEQVVLLTERDEATEHRENLEGEAKVIARKIGNLVEAMEEGRNTPTLLGRVRELETRQSEIRKELAEMRPVPWLPPAVVEGRLAEWRRLLRASVTQGRAVLQRVLRGRVQFNPLPPLKDGRQQCGYYFEATTRFERLSAGVALLCLSHSPQGS